MIHSLSGGELSVHLNHDYAKVRLNDGYKAGECLWFISEIEDLEVGDMVLVQSISGETNKGYVERIDRNVNELSFPIPYKRMKRIIKRLNEMN